MSQPSIHRYRYRWRQLQLPWALSAGPAPHPPLAMRGHGHPELAHLEDLLSHHAWEPAAGDEELWLRLNTLLATLPLKTTLIVPESLEHAFHTVATAVASSDGDSDAVVSWGEAIAQALDAPDLKQSGRESAGFSEASVVGIARTLSRCEQPWFLLAGFDVPRGRDFEGSWCASVTAAERLGRVAAEGRLDCLPALFRECQQMVCDRGGHGGEYNAVEAFAILRGWALTHQQLTPPPALGPELLSLLVEAFTSYLPLDGTSWPEYLHSPEHDLSPREPFLSGIDSRSLGRLLADLQLRAAQVASLFSQLAIREASQPVDEPAASAQRQERTLLRSLLKARSRRREGVTPLFSCTLELLRRWAEEAHFARWQAAERAHLLNLIKGSSAEAEVVAAAETAADASSSAASVEELLLVARGAWWGAVADRLARDESREALLDTTVVTGVDLMQDAQRAARKERCKRIDDEVDCQMRWLDPEEAASRFGTCAFEISSDGLEGRYSTIDERYCYGEIWREAKGAAAHPWRFIETADASRVGDCISRLGLQVEELMQITSAIAVTEVRGEDPLVHTQWIRATKDENGLVDKFPFASGLLRAWAAATDLVPTRAETARCSHPDWPGSNPPPPSLTCLAASTLLASWRALPQAAESFALLGLRLPEQEAARCVDAMVAAAEGAWHGESERVEERERLGTARRKREQDREFARQTRRRLAESTGSG